jgi:phosphoglycerol transferase MdoB-like AlkP superfamily enzyme
MQEPGPCKSFDLRDDLHMTATSKGSEKDRWGRFFRQWQRDFKLWIFFMTFFLAFRIIFILIFKDQMGKGTTLASVASAILNGMRFDSVVSTFFVLIPFLFSAASYFKDFEQMAQKVRIVTGGVFLVLSSFLCIVTLEYFREFGDQFNHFLFGLIYDDLQATMLTIIKSYHVLTNTLVFFLALVTGSYLIRKLVGNPMLSREMNARFSSSGSTRTAFTIVIITLTVFGARGSIGAMPVRERHAGITVDEFLNKTVLNPYTSLRYAIAQQIKLSKTEGIRTYIPDQDLIRASQDVFAVEERHTDLDRYLLRHARGPKGIPPRHIFYIVAESYSSWPMWERYEPLHIADGLKGLARDGISITPFIAASQGTMASLNTIVTGLPDADIQTNYRPSSRKPYPTTTSRIFREMGYRTRLFYGGYLSWQRVGDFCRDQGFEEIYGGGHMGKWASSNEWGVDDEHIFSFVTKTVSDDRPSFNLILTSSFHPPYTVDILSKGFPAGEIPASILDTPIEQDDLTFLGHFWYADRCLEGFARAITRGLPQSLVVVTADHPGRRWISKNPDPLEKYLVPCVLYGPEVLTGIHPPRSMAGSHLDINPTLVELAAPKGFPYHAMGRDFLDPQTRAIAVGKNLVLSPLFLMDFHKAPRIAVLPGASPSLSDQTIKDLKRLHDAMHGIAWWRIMKGPSFSLQ